MITTPAFANVLFAVLLLAQQPAQPKPDAEIEAALTRIKADLAAGRLTVQDVLTSPDWLPLHEQPRFRRIIRENAPAGPLTIVPSDEPGTPLVVSGTVRDGAGKPIAGALIYAFHTAENGSYSSRGGNVADMGDSLNPRLFGYVRTDAEGRYELRTIRPGQYPTDGPPAHVHVEITAEKFAKLVSEIMLEDDSRMTPQTKEWAAGAGFVVAGPTKDAAGVQRCTADWVLKPA